VAKSRWAISFEDIYHGYNYDSLNYLIGIIHMGFASIYLEKIYTHINEYTIKSISSIYGSRAAQVIFGDLNLDFRNIVANRTG
jgi:hypothetical protein